MAQIVVADTDIEEQVVSGERVVTVAPHERGATNLALGLAMLLMNVVNSIELASTAARLRITIARDTKALRSARLGVRWRGNELAAQLSTNQLELCLTFLLRYLRDGSGDVDHVDLEGERTAEGITTVVLKVPRARPPMSAEEARRELSE